MLRDHETELRKLGVERLPLSDSADRDEDNEASTVKLDSDFERQWEIAERIMHRDRDALKALAKL